MLSLYSRCINCNFTIPSLLCSILIKLILELVLLLTASLLSICFLLNKAYNLGTPVLLSTLQIQICSTLRKFRSDRSLIIFCVHCSFHVSCQLSDKAVIVGVSTTEQLNFLCK